MVSFFRIFGIFQGLFIILWAFFLRLPYILYTLPSIISKTTWKNQGPLSELLFTAISYSNLPEHLLSFWGAFFLVIIQVFLIQKIFSDNPISVSYKSLPGILYVCMASLLPDFYFLSPELVGSVFLIAVLGIVLKYMHTSTSKNDAFKVGFFTGIATLFYLPYFVFVLGGTLCIVLFARASLKNYFLIIWGFIFAVFLCTVFLFASDDIAGIERASIILSEFTFYVSDFRSEVQFFLSAVVFSGIILFVRLPGARSIMPSNYYLFLNVSLVWSIFALGVWYFMGEVDQSRLVAQIPPAVLWSATAISLQRKRAIREVLFFIFLILPLIAYYVLV